MFRSIRFRLALWYTAVIALTFLLFSIIVYEYLDKTLSDELDQSVTSESRWMVARLEKRMLRQEPHEIVRDDIIEHLAYYPRKEYVEIWDSTGSIFYHSRNLADDTLAQYTDLSGNRPWQLETVKNFRDYEIRLSIDKTPAMTVLVAMPREVSVAPLNYLLRILAWLGPVLIVVAFVGGTYLAKKSFSKVNQIIETVKKISADRLYDRIPEHDVPDEIGKLTETFNDMISRLHFSFKQMKQFSADASHELRTPLPVMRAQLETALDNKIPPMELKKIVANCLDESIHMTNIVESLLLLAKADVGQDVIKFEPVDLKSLLHQMYDESVILASQKSITVTLETLDQVTVMGDAQRLRQMLLNLIDNAIKHNHINGRIEISLTRENGKGNIHITDTGIGIPESEIPRIFDRFYRVDRARSRQLGGAGLGLSIVYWIVQAHGGSIRVKSQIDKGSEFDVLLPLIS